MANVIVPPVDQITICNMAISRTGQGEPIGSLDDSTMEARLCGLHYINSLQTLLGEFSWRFATKKAALALLFDATQASVAPVPNQESSLNFGTPWVYQYAYPADCIKNRRLPNGYRHDHLSTLAEYEIGDGLDPGGNPIRIIYSNLANAWAQYVYLMLDPSRYPPLFVKALSYSLAMEIAPALTQKDNVAQKMAQLYTIWRDKAIAEDLREGNREIPRVSDAELARAGWGRGGPWGSYGPGSVGPAGPSYIVLG